MANLADMMGNSHITWHSVLNFVLGMGLLTLDRTWTKLIGLFGLRQGNLTIMLYLSEGLYVIGTFGWFFVVYGLVMLLKEMQNRLAQPEETEHELSPRRITR